MHYILGKCVSNKKLKTKPSNVKIQIVDWNYKIIMKTADVAESMDSTMHLGSKRHWVLRLGVKQGIFWSIIAYLQCAVQDVYVRTVSVINPSLKPQVLVFFRFLFSFISIVLFLMTTHKVHLVKTRHHVMHAARGVIGVVMLACCAYSVMKLDLASNSALLFSQGLISVCLSVILFKEKINVRVIVSLLIGISGALMIAFANSNIGNDCGVKWRFNPIIFVTLFAAFLGSVSSIMIKKMMNMKENMLTMLFYFGAYTTLFSIVPALKSWAMPGWHELIYLCLYGLGANFLQLFLFLAYRATEVSKISHMQYIELPFSILFGYVFFSEVPNKFVFVGIVLIVMSVAISSAKIKRERHSCAGC